MVLNKESREGFRWQPIHWSIQAKIVGSFLLMAVVLGLALISFTYWQITAKAAPTAGEEMLAAGEEVMQSIGEQFAGNINELAFLTRAPAVVNAVDAANGNEPSQSIEEMDAAWQNGDARADVLKQSLQENDLSQVLLDFEEHFSNQVETFVTDQRGLVVGMTSTTGDYLQADEDWWQQAYDGGTGALYVGTVEYDDSAATWGVTVGVPVRAADESVLGVLRGTIDVTALLADLSALQFGETGAALLLDREGRILSARDPALQMQIVPESIASLLAGDEMGWHAGVEMDQRAWERGRPW